MIVIFEIVKRSLFYLLCLFVPLFAAFFLSVSFASIFIVFFLRLPDFLGIVWLLHGRACHLFFNSAPKLGAFVIFDTPN